MHRITPEPLCALIPPQERQCPVELQAEQQHRGIQQRLTALSGVVGGAPAVELSLEVGEVVGGACEGSTSVIGGVPEV